MKYIFYAILASLLLSSCGSDSRTDAWKNSFTPRELPEEIFTLDLAEDEIILNQAYKHRHSKYQRFREHG